MYEVERETEAEQDVAGVLVARHPRIAERAEEDGVVRRQPVHLRGVMVLPVRR